MDRSAVFSGIPWQLEPEIGEETHKPRAKSVG